MESKKKNKLFFRVLLILFLIFAALMISLNSGYYEAKKRESIALTSKSIKKYENALKKGEQISLDSFMDKKTVNYSNTFSEAGETLTNGVEKIMSKGFKTIFGVLKTLF